MGYLYIVLALLSFFSVFFSIGKPGRSNFEVIILRLLVFVFLLFKEIITFYLLKRE